MIVKEVITREDRPDGYNFAACSDGSDKSMQCLDLMCQMRQDKDRIEVIICEQENLDSYFVKQKVSDYLEEKNCLDKTHIHILKSEPGKKAKDLIREHITEKCGLYTDFVFIGNTGADFSGHKSKYLGSVANEILCHTKVNTVFISHKR